MNRELSLNQKIGFGASVVALSLVVVTSPMPIFGAAALLGLLWSLWDVL